MKILGALILLWIITEWLDYYNPKSRVFKLYGFELSNYLETKFHFPRRMGESDVWYRYRFIDWLEEDTKCVKD